MKLIRVTLSTKDQIVTRVNRTYQEVCSYYLGRRLNLGSTADNMQTANKLKPNGSIVSVMAAGVKFRSTGVFKEWNRFLRGKYHSMIDLPKNAFKVSETGINTVLVGLTRFDTCLQYHVYEYNERKTIEISNVPDEMYGITTAIVDAERFMKGQKYFPCASGNNIALTEEMKQEIRKLLDMEKVHAA